MPLKTTKAKHKIWLIVPVLMTISILGCSSTSKTPISASEQVKPHYSKEFLQQVDKEYDSLSPTMKEVVKDWENLAFAH